MTAQKTERADAPNFAGSRAGGSKGVDLMSIIHQRAAGRKDRGPKHPVDRDRARTLADGKRSADRIRERDDARAANVDPATEAEFARRQAARAAGADPDTGEAISQVTLSTEGFEVESVTPPCVCGTYVMLGNDTGDRLSVWCDGKNRSCPKCSEEVAHLRHDAWGELLSRAGIAPTADGWVLIEALDRKAVGAVRKTMTTRRDSSGLELPGISGPLGADGSRWFLVYAPGVAWPPGYLVTPVDDALARHDELIASVHATAKAMKLDRSDTRRLGSTTGVGPFYQALAEVLDEMRFDASSGLQAIGIAEDALLHSLEDMTAKAKQLGGQTETGNTQRRFRVRFRDARTADRWDRWMGLATFAELEQRKRDREMERELRRMLDDYRWNEPEMAT